MTEMEKTLRSIVKTFRMPSIDANAPVSEAILKMVDEDSYALLIPRSDTSDAFGIITKKDIIKKVVAEGKDPKKVKIGEVASKPLIILTNLNLDIKWVAKAMSNSEISVVAVFDQGDFYGFVTDKCIVESIYYSNIRHKLDTGSQYVSC